MHESQDDSFKWFGEGFDGFPKRLPDDSIEYFLYHVDSQLDDAAIREKLRKVQTAATALTKRLLKDFIWQREAFNLNLDRKDGHSYLRGITNHGDSVEDEWLVVYLLRELSKQFPDVWIKVTDSDGEFLLIEAANTLPKWLNPEIADNRVWINGGALLIIPPRKAAKGTDQPAATGSLPLSTALNTISTSRSSLLHTRIVEEEAFYRLRNYPEQINKNLHNALLTIPRRLAFILHANPAYISPAVEAFYLRDPIALKPLKETDTKGLLLPPEDFVTARVRFTKVGYAQVKSQQFPAPGAWARALSPNAGSKAKERAETGMKLACGMEMLLQDVQSRDKRVVREIKLLLEDVDAGEEQLPDDAEVRSWGTDEDDEGWLDIDFQDLESELAGKAKTMKGGGGSTGDFGDKAAQENLRKMVERFEEFMNEDELEDMDDDDDDSEDDSELSEDGAEGDGEDKDASFDEDEFSEMMREMMGMPPDVMKEIMGPHAAKAKGVARDDEATNPKVFETVEKPFFGPVRPPHMQELGPDVRSSTAKGKQPVRGTSSSVSDDDDDDDDIESIPRGYDSDSEDDDEAEIQDLSAAMEAELKRAGALTLDDPKASKAGKRVTRGKGRAVDENLPEDGEQDAGSDEEMLDDNFNLVSNMLESFKSQAGMAGPGGNMLGMMGMKLPRDEGDRKEHASSSGKKRES